MGIARADMDPAVETAAVEALTRLALGEVIPLPAALELVPYQGGAPARSLADGEIQAVLGELGGWLSKVSQEDAGRLPTLPIAAAGGSLDVDRARPLAQVLAGIHQA